MENKILFEELIKSNELVIPIFKKDILELLGMTCLNGYIEKGQLQAGDNIKYISTNFTKDLKVKRLEIFQKTNGIATCGDYVSILVEHIEKDNFSEVGFVTK